VRPALGQALQNPARFGWLRLVAPPSGLVLSGPTPSNLTNLNVHFSPQSLFFPFPRKRIFEFVRVCFENAEGDVPTHAAGGMPNFCGECGAKQTATDPQCAQCGASAGPHPSAPSFSASSAVCARLYDLSGVPREYWLALCVSRVVCPFSSVLWIQHR